MAIQRYNGVSFKANEAAQVAKASKTSRAAKFVKGLAAKVAKQFEYVDSFQKIKWDNDDISQINTYSGRPIFPKRTRQQLFNNGKLVFDEKYGTHGAGSRQAVKPFENGGHTLVIDSDDYRIDARINSQKEIIGFVPIPYSEKGKAAIAEFEATQKFAKRA